MNANFRVVLDACVLANFGLCDLFLTLAETPRLYQPVWNRKILDEVRDVMRLHHYSEYLRSSVEIGRVESGNQ